MPTVLIVDDHPSFRATARLLLEGDGFDVVGEAADGAVGAAGARTTCSPTSSCSTSTCPDLDGFDGRRGA